jgi:hypothetical protein
VVYKKEVFNKLTVEIVDPDWQLIIVATVEGL